MSLSAPCVRTSHYQNIGIGCFTCAEKKKERKQMIGVSIIIDLENIDQVFCSPAASPVLSQCGS